MLQIAIVEDEPNAAELLAEHLRRFQTEENIVCAADRFADGVNFISEYKPKYDAVFMDIEMPHLLGTDTARRLREMDTSVALVFITNMAQYAINGYEVDAIDYILKPVSYYRFAAMLKKIISRRALNAGDEINIRTPNGVVRINDTDIFYLEVEDHLLLYHTGNGVIETWDTLKAAEEKLNGRLFVRISKSRIVNLRHISAVKGGEIVVDGRTLPVSRRQKGDFMKALNDFAAR